MSAELPELVVPHAAAWRSWLAEHHGLASGTWLVLAKKTAPAPTELRYEDALPEALCFGWIDGQVRRRDAGSYLQRFTPRTRRSRWSQRNVALAESLIAEGRMAPAGLAAVTAARLDGRWHTAYPGPAAAEVPADLAAALDSRPAARVAFDGLSGQNRYSVLYRVATATRPETRRRRIDQLVAMLADGRTPHPQGPGASG